MNSGFESRGRLVYSLFVDILVPDLQAGRLDDTTVTEKRGSNPP